MHDNIDGAFQAPEATVPSKGAPLPSILFVFLHLLRAVYDDACRFIDAVC
jgi:hypothetical protein